MNILLIQTGITKEQQKAMGEGNIHRVNMPMLGLLYLAALTPPEHQLTVIDENHGLIEKYEKYDIVGISGMTMHAERMYALADIYRNLGCHVVLGGVHVSFMIQEALEHCDTVMVKEGEVTWLQFLKDFEEGRAKKVYETEIVTDLARLPRPPRELVDGEAYKAPHGTLNSIVATRGCPNHCTFCCVRKMFDKCFRIRPVDSIVDEIKGMDENIIIFQDDNIVGNFSFARELFTKIRPLNRLWGAQGSINVAANRELLHLMADSGCRTLFVGFESINPKNLLAIGKSGVNRISQYEENIRKIHDCGIKIFGSFIVGLDDDDDGVFDHIYEFCYKNQIDFPIVNCLTPFPGTELFEALDRENRILDKTWSRYNLTNVLVKPLHMSADKMQFEYNTLVHYLNKMTYENMKKFK